MTECCCGEPGRPGDHSVWLCEFSDAVGTFYVIQNGLTLGHAKALADRDSRIAELEGALGELERWSVNLPEPEASMLLARVRKALGKGM